MNIIFVSFILLRAVWAAFDPAELQGKFRAIAGSNPPDQPVGRQCGEQLRFFENGLNIPAQDIELDDVRCEGGALQLVANPSQGAFSGLASYFSRVSETLGDYYGANLTGKLTCGERMFFRSNTYMIFLRPDQATSITWRDVVGEGTALEDGTQPTFTFEKGRAYVIAETRCMYERRRVDDDDDDDGDDDDDNVCLDGEGLVEIEGGGRKRVADLEIGDRVLVDKGIYSKVFAFTHRTRASNPWYVRIEGGGKAVTVTAGHYVFVGDGLKKAKDVKAGDIMWSGEGDEIQVERLRWVKSWGLYNPQTMDGGIVVNGIRVTTFTEAVHPVAAHALLAPLRAFGGRWLLPSIETTLGWHRDV